MRNFFNYLTQYQTDARLDERKLKDMPPVEIPLVRNCESVRNFFYGNNVRYEVITTYNGFDYQATVVDANVHSLTEFEREISNTLSEMNLKAQTCVVRERKADTYLVKIHVN